MVMWRPTGGGACVPEPSRSPSGGYSAPATGAGALSLAPGSRRGAESQQMSTPSVPASETSSPSTPSLVASPSSPAASGLSPNGAAGSTRPARISASASSRNGMSSEALPGSGDAWAGDSRPPRNMSLESLCISIEILAASAGVSEPLLARSSATVLLVAASVSVAPDAVLPSPVALSGAPGRLVANPLRVVRYRSSCALYSSRVVFDGSSESMNLARRFKELDSCWKGLMLGYGLSADLAASSCFDITGILLLSANISSLSCGVSSANSLLSLTSLLSLLNSSLPTLSRSTGLVSFSSISSISMNRGLVSSGGSSR
mmetsp:Transcript_10947/g.27662  ORF Transcript_10947/g.27662 Transcript_10947/m.27662 type:complete len:317 (-) Transcript_10947:351-1301(-)